MEKKNVSNSFPKRTANGSVTGRPGCATIGRRTIAVFAFGQTVGVQSKLCAVVAVVRHQCWGFLCDQYAPESGGIFNGTYFLFGIFVTQLVCFLFADYFGVLSGSWTGCGTHWAVHHIGRNDGVGLLWHRAGQDASFQVSKICDLRTDLDF